MLYKSWMKLSCIFLLGVQTLCGTDWTPPVDTGAGSQNFVFGAYNPQLQTMFATWAHSVNGNPYYWTYKNGQTSVNPINTTDPIFEGLFISYIDSGVDIGRMVATGEYDNFGSLSFLPVAYVFDPVSMSWSSGTLISNTSQVQDQVITVYNSESQTLFAAWVDDGSSLPTFAYYNSRVWTGVDTAPAQASSDNIGLAYDSKSGVVFAAWGDNSTFYPTFATYPSSGTPWSNAQPISTLSTVNDEVFLVYNPSMDAVFAAWTDDNTGATTYSIYSNGVWSTPAQIISPIVTKGLDNVYLAYDSQTQQVFATWVDDSTKMPWYAIYDPVAQLWNAGMISHNSVVFDDVTLAYASGFSTMFSFWTDSNNGDMIWSSYINQVTNLTARKIVNDFGTESENFAQVRWSFGPTLNILGFHIYQNGKLIGSVGPQTNQFAVHDLAPGIVNTFAVTAFNIYGESIPVTVTVK